MRLQAPPVLAAVLDEGDLLHCRRCPARPVTPLRMSAPSPNITMNRNRISPFYTGFRIRPLHALLNDMRSRRADHGGWWCAWFPDECDAQAAAVGPGWLLFCGAGGDFHGREKPVNLVSAFR
jgi:hypothetical protein